MESSSQAGDGSLRDELRGDAETLTGTAKQKLHSELDSRKGPAVSQVKSVSSALEAAASELSDSPNWLRSAVAQGAQALQRFGDSVEHKDSRELTREAQQIARANPGMFLAACAAAGFAGARILKAGAEDAAAGPPEPRRSYEPDPLVEGSQGASAFPGLNTAGGPAQADPQPVYQGGM